MMRPMMLETPAANQPRPLFHLYDALTTAAVEGAVFPVAVVVKAMAIPVAKAAPQNSDIEFGENDPVAGTGNENFGVVVPTVGAVESNICR